MSDQEVVLSSDPRIREARALLQKIFPMTRHLNDMRAEQTIAEAFDALRAERDQALRDLAEAREEVGHLKLERQEILDNALDDIRNARNEAIDECAAAMERTQRLHPQDLATALRALKTPEHPNDKAAE